VEVSHIWLDELQSGAFLSEDGEVTDTNAK